MWAEAASPFNMLTHQERHLSRLLLTVLLLSDWTAEGAQNGSEVEAASSVRLSSDPSSRDIVVREGSSTLIECNVTGGHDDIKWFNSKGPLLGEGAGRRRVLYDIRTDTWLSLEVKARNKQPYTVFSLSLLSRQHQESFFTVWASDSMPSLSVYFEHRNVSYRYNCISVKHVPKSSHLNSVATFLHEWWSL